MKHTCIILATVLAAALSASAKTFDWPIDATTAGARQFTAYHGETIRFNLLFKGAMTNLAPVCIYYQTNGMGNAEWFGPIPGTVFHPTNDCGAAFYRFFIRCTDPDGVNYSANGSLRMLDSPGFEPSAVQLPVQTLDFSKIEVLNPPWGEGGGGVDASTITNIAETVATNATRELQTNLENGNVAVAASYMASDAHGLSGVYQGSRSADEIILQLDAASETNAMQQAAMRNFATKSDVESGWWSEWSFTQDSAILGLNYTLTGSGDWWMLTIFYDDGTIWDEVNSTTDAGGTTITFETSYFGSITFFRHRYAGAIPTNPSDIGAASPGTVSNIVTKAYVEDLGIKGGGSELEDEVRHCTWVQCVTNGVFYWIVKEEE